MNDKKYDGVYYKVRKVEDIKELICTSSEMFADHAAYLQKNKETDKFEPITYAEVKQDMDGLGTRLMSMGLAGKKIAVIGETSYSWVLTYFAVVSGVGVIVPLDKNLPSGELIGLVERSGAAAIVYSSKCRKNIESLFEDPKSIEYFIPMNEPVANEHEIPLTTLVEEGRDMVEQGDTSYTDIDVDPDQMSTLLFTSGTTGAAKGVMLSHRNIVSNCVEMSKFFKIPEPGIVLSILPVHHVYEMTCDIMTTFYQGKTIEASDMQMGLRTISIDEIVQIGNKYYIKGNNFTQYSYVTLDGEKLDTTYLSPTLLALEQDIDPEVAKDLKVSQIEKYDTILSTTE